MRFKLGVGLHWNQDKCHHQTQHSVHGEAWPEKDSCRDRDGRVRAMFTSPLPAGLSAPSGTVTQSSPALIAAAVILWTPFGTAATHEWTTINEEKQMNEWTYHSSTVTNFVISSYLTMSSLEWGLYTNSSNWIQGPSLAAWYSVSTHWTAGKGVNWVPTGGLSWPGLYVFASAFVVWI